MKTRLFYTTGKQDIHEISWDKPEPTINQIEVKNIFTGVCRSDIDMYTGDFQTLPKEIQGHEGLGEVTKVGKNVRDVKEGDIVATRGEPSFADYYNADKETFVIVPAAEPKYIIEPVACALNIFNTAWGDMIEDSDVLLLGTGFLAQALYKTIRYRDLNYPITVVGNANKKFWIAQDVNLISDFSQLASHQYTFDVIFDLSDKPEYMISTDHINPEATIILAAEKHPEMILPMGDLLWKAVSILFPSPHNATFIHAMREAVEMIEDGTIDSQSMWTQEYDRDREVKLAFEDGVNRPEGYQRGYIKW